MSMTGQDKSKTGTYVDISVVSIARLIRSRKITFSVTFVSILAASIAYAFLATPVYRSEVIVSPSAGGMAAGGGLARALGGFGGFGALLGGGSTTRTARAVGLSALTSPFFTRAFIEDRNLMPILFAEDWDSEKGEWAVTDPDDVPTLSDGYDLFVEDVLEVIENDRTGLITVAVEWKDPEIAAEWANELVAGVNERLRTRAIREADLTINVLNEEVAQTSAVELQQALYAMIEGEIEKRTVARVQKDYSFNVLSPALAADSDKFEWPNRPFIISVGALVGFFGALFLIAILGQMAEVSRELQDAD